LWAASNQSFELTGRRRLAKPSLLVILRDQ
jgi:hypothetical protein